jgi:hypothetical protein
MFNNYNYYQTIRLLKFKDQQFKYEIKILFYYILIFNIFLL